MDIQVLKKIITPILIIAIVAAAVLKVSPVVEKKRGHELNDEFVEYKGDYDVVFFGSSHVDMGIDPQQLWRDYGITSYNMGNDAMDIKQTYWTIKVALNYHEPKVIVLDCNGVGNIYGDKPEGKGVGLVHDAFDCFPLSKAKVEAATDMYKRFDNLMDFLFPFSVYRGRWNELTEEDFNKNLQNLNHGAEIENNHKYFAGDSKSDIIPIDTSDGLPEDAVYLQKLIGLCEEKDIPLVLIYLPFIAEGQRVGEAKLAGDIAEEAGITYFNMLDMDVVDYRTDMQEFSHLNALGAKKVTSFLGDYLVSTYELGSHWGDPEFDDWAESYNTYKDEYLLPKITEQENFKTLLTQLSNPEFGAYISVFNGTTFDEAEQLMLDQIPNLYGVSDGDPNDNRKRCDFRVYVYDTDSGEEIAIKEFSRDMTLIQTTDDQ